MPVTGYFYPAETASAPLLFMIRTDWTRADIAAIYNTPVLDLMYRAATVHRQHHDPQEVQVCTLLSVKTGGCPEDCAYCP